MIDEKSHKNILIYDISNKNLICPKYLQIRFSKIDGFIRIYDGTRYLKLFGSENYDAIYSRIRSHKSKKRYHCMKNNINVKSVNVNIIFLWFSTFDGKMIFPAKQKLKKKSYFL